VKRLAITDWIKNDNKGQFWNGNHTHNLNKYDIKANKDQIEPVISRASSQMYPGLEQYMSVDDESVSEAPLLKRAQT